MKFLKAFSGEETKKQKKIRVTFLKGSTAFFLMLLHITRLDKCIKRLDSTSRMNKLILFTILGCLMIAMQIHLFYKQTHPITETLKSDRVLIESMNARKQIMNTQNPRILRLAQLLDSLKVNETKIKYDTVYRNEVERFLIDKMSEENLMYPIINQKENNVEHKSGSRCKFARPFLFTGKFLPVKL